MPPRGCMDWPRAYCKSFICSKSCRDWNWSQTVLILADLTYGSLKRKWFCFAASCLWFRLSAGQSPGRGVNWGRTEVIKCLVFHFSFSGLVLPVFSWTVTRFLTTKREKSPCIIAAEPKGRSPRSSRIFNECPQCTFSMCASICFVIYFTSGIWTRCYFLVKVRKRLREIGWRVMVT